MGLDQRDIEELTALEESLWRVGTRFDHQYMERVLASRFVEFGRSGRVYSRQEILGSSAGEINALIPLRDLAIRQIADRVVLVTYVSEVTYDTVELANRSSLWVKEQDGWKLVFHQGTPIP